METITITKADFDKIILPLLQKREKELRLELAKLDIVIDALEREDFRNLGPGLIEYMKSKEEQSAEENLKVSPTDEPMENKTEACINPLVSGQLLAKCGDCGQVLTEVRPGKHQCDNELCASNCR